METLRARIRRWWVRWRFRVLRHVEEGVRWVVRRGPRHYAILLSLIVGTLCGLAAVLLKNTILWIHTLVINSVGQMTESLLFLLLPGVGILLAYLFVRYVVRDSIGQGVSKILLAISRHRGRLARHNVYSSIVSSSLTIGFGGSVGAESPIVLTGAAIGSNVARFFRADARVTTLMLGCGAAAGIAAIFKAPLAGMVFTLEVLLLDLTMNSIIPLLLSAVSATIVSFFLLGDAALFHFEYNVPFDLSKTLYYVLLGVVTGFVSLYFMRMGIRAGHWFGAMRSPWRRLLVGSLGLGVLIFFFPALYGEGYESIQMLFEGQQKVLFAYSPLGYAMDNSWLAILCLTALCLVKVFAMAATTGAGGIGGSFAPTLFVGAVTGAVLAELLNSFGAGVGEANFVLVGMAGTMAGVMHAPLLGIFLIAELTEGYALLLPLMIVATISYITIAPFEPHSIYTKRLAERGELITHHKDKAVLTMLQLSKVVETDLLTVKITDTLRALVRTVAASHRNIFPVVDNDNRFQGIVLLDDIRHVMFEQDRYDDYTVKDFITTPPAIISIEEPMEQVMAKFEETKAWNLPVLSGPQYVGFVSKAKIFSAYRDLLVSFSNE